MNVKQKSPLALRLPLMSLSEKVRLGSSGDRSARSLLAREHNKLILNGILQNPRISDEEILQFSNERTLSEEMLTLISKRREWMKQYPIRLALTQNPRTSIAVALKQLPTFRDGDLRRIARSKDVNRVVAAGARRILMTRGGD